MKAIWKNMVVGVLLFGMGGAAAATDLTLHLRGSAPIRRMTVHYRCDAQGVKMGLPAASFPVEYINGAGNSLAVLPIHGKSLIFANVISGSGARYAAGEYIWWEEAGRTVSLSSDSLAGKMRSECHRVKSN